MMILIALLFHILGHKIPLWITGQKMSDVRIKGGLRQVYFELSGIIFIFLIAFLILTVLGLSTKERYLLNEDVIYGLNFNKSAKELGFNNGDKIVSVNDKVIIEYNDILEDMLFAYKDVRIGITREGYDTVIILTNKEILGLFKDGTRPFMPRLNSDSVFNPRNDLIYSERQQSFAKSLSFFPITVRQVVQLFAPRHSNLIGFPLQKITNVASFIHRICWNLIFFGLLNLLPIPGLDLGNVSIALIETTKRRRFNEKRIKIVRYVCIGIISLMMVSTIIYSKV